jgi:hypothetical protein
MSITQKIFLAALVCCLMGASSMFGAQLNAFCAPTGTFAGGVGGPLAETCGSFTTDGGGTIGTGAGTDTITGVQIFLVADYQVGLAASNSVTVNFGAPSAGSFSAPAVDPCVVTGASSSSTNTCGVYSGNVNAPGTTSETSGLAGAALQTFAGANFTVAVTSAMSGGSVQQSAGDVIVQYTYTANSITTTPEPATLGLVGSVLLGIGLLSRKRLAR